MSSEDQKPTRPLRDYGAILVPLGGGVLSWLIVLWYSDEVEAFDAQAPYWAVSLATALVVGMLVGAPRERVLEETNYRAGRPFSDLPKFRPVEIGMVMALGQFLAALVLGEEYTFIVLGGLILAVSGLVFSAAALGGIMLRQFVRDAR